MRFRNFLALIFLLPTTGLLAQSLAFEFSGVVTANGKTQICLTEMTTGNYESRWLPAPGGVWNDWKVGAYKPAPPTSFKVSTAIDDTKSHATVEINSSKLGRRQVLQLKDALVTQTGPQPVRPIINNPNNTPPDPPQTIIVNGKVVTVQAGQSVEQAINKACGVKKKPTATAVPTPAPAPTPTN